MDYKWSSHQVYLGLQELPYLTMHWLLSQFAKTVPTARRKFAEFVDKGREEGHRKEYYHGEHDSRVLGDDRFAEEVLSLKRVTRKPSLDAIIKYVCRQNNVTEKELRSLSRKRKLSEIRGIIGWFVTRLEASTLSEVAKRFNRDLSTISRAVRNIEERKLKSETLDTGLQVFFCIKQTHHNHDI